jgi:CHAT domain-containing protein
VYTGREASESVVKDLAPQTPVLHFATHAVLDNTHPMFSRILLAADPTGREDGLLEAWEIMDLRLDADLVVLSACDTARGKIGAGGGVVGMAWAFFAAGARTVVASQWNVSSSRSADLMVAFHRALRAGRQTPAAALRTAKLDLMNRQSSAHPFYWAPFVLVGARR